jgi:hypothetical protein
MTEHGVGFVDAKGPQCLCESDFPYVAGGWVAFNSHLRAVTEAALDVVYRDRNLVVQAFASAMEGLGYHVAWGPGEGDPEWPVLYVHTGHGQVSWHIPRAERLYEPEDRTGSFGALAYDGHTDAEKAHRLRLLLADLSPERL